MNIGRNDPCSCGSGKKFKKCCGGAIVSIAAANPGVARADTLKRLDNTLHDELLRLAKKRYGLGWLADAISAYIGSDDEVFDDAEQQLAIPWALYHYHGNESGESIAQIMLSERRSRLTPDLLELLEAQCDAWLSVWEAQEVQRNVGIALKDLLTGNQLFAYDRLASESLVVRDAVMGRVVTCNGVSFISGLHPRSLPPRHTDFVVREMKRFCRVRTRPVAVEKLRDETIQRGLLDSWWVALDQFDGPRSLPTLQNTDGDALIMTVDHFGFAATDRGEIIERLLRIEGTEQLAGKRETEIPICKTGNAVNKAWNTTQIGRLLIGDKRIRAETNSIERADALRSLIETVAGPLVKHRIREGSSPIHELDELKKTFGGNSSSGRFLSPQQMSAEFKAIALQIKERHMLGWIDEQIPALGGLTPREAAASPKSRAKLDLLLRDFEHREAQLPADEQFDIGRLRTALGLAQ